MSLVLIAVMAFVSVASAQQSPAAESAVTTVPPSDPAAPMAALPKEERLKLIADLLQQLSDADYLGSAPAGGKPFRASRADAISAVYGTLAALEYQKAMRAGPAAEAKPQVEAALRTRLQDADALAVNPDTLEEAGWWSNFQSYVENRLQTRHRTTAVLAVRGGRSIDTEAEKKAAKLKKAIQEAEKRLAQPDLPSAEQAAAHFEQGKLYDELAACGLGSAPAPSAAEKESRLQQAADLLQQLSDEDYLRTASPGGRPFRPTRAEAISTVYGTLAALKYQQAMQAGPEEDERREVEAALRTRLQDAGALAVSPDTLEEAGWFSSFVNYVNSQDYRSSYRGAAVAAVRGGRSIDTEAERRAAKLRKELQEVSLKITRPGAPRSRPSKWLYRAGRIYDELSSCGLGAAPVPVVEPPQAEVVKEPAQPEPVVDQVKAGTAELDKMGREMQEEIDKRRAPTKAPSR